MPTTQSSTSKSSSKSGGKSTTAKSSSRGTSGQKDAIQLLKADHREVEKLFRQFQQAKDEGSKQQIAERICMELRVHSQLEEELFYPVSREFLRDDEIVNEAVVEHNAAKDMIEQIEAMQPSDEMFEAKVTVLQEQIEHHVQEEEKEYFPQVQKTEMDLKGIGQQIMARKQELMAQMGGQQGRALQ